MFKSTLDKEAKFVACLLANGPPPSTSVLGQAEFTTYQYKEKIMDWWRASHQSLPAITDKGVHRFYNRYKRWLANERYHRRRHEGTVDS